MNKRVGLYACILGCLIPLQAYDLNVNGFINATMGKSDNSETSVAGYGNTKASTQSSNADSVKFQPDSLVGLQISSNVSDNFSATLQFIGDFKNDQANINLEWGYVSYNIDSLQIQMGRYRPAIYMYSDSRHVAYSYLWTRLPIDVYGSAPLTYLDGVNLIYNYEFDNEITIATKIFYGNRNADESVAGLDYTLSYDNAFGAEVVLNNEYGKLRAGYACSTLSGVFGAPIDTTPGLKMDNTKVEFFSFGATVDYDNLILIGEMTKRVLDPSILAEELKNYYVTFGYRIDAFTPNVTYSYLKSDILESANALVNTTKKNLERDQRSITTGLRYEANPSTAVKVEWMRTDQKQLSGSVASTVTNLYTVSVNMVF